MSRQRAPQGAAGSPQPELQLFHLQNAAPDLSRKVYLTMAEAAYYLSYRTVHAFECAVSKARQDGTAPMRCGTVRRACFFRRDLDAWVSGKNKPASERVLEIVEARHRQGA